MERVEDWRFYEKTILEQHHFGWIKLNFDRASSTEEVEEKGRSYRMRGGVDCAEGERLVEDELEWTTVGIRGEVLDRFRILRRTRVSLK